MTAIRFYAVETDGAITRILPGTRTNEGTPLEERADQEIRVYLAGERRTFSFPVRALGTEFQRAVWDAARAIPYGERRTYAEIAEAIGTRAYRAVGTALAKNPVPLFIPCHRVVGKKDLGGYAFGLEMKRELLEMERRSVERSPSSDGSSF